MSELLALPDDALLAVLAYLKPRELFGLRVVCRRLRDVCLHPELWRTAVVKADDKGLLRATFTLAPCLGELSAVSALPPLDILSLNTDCAVALLDLLVQQTKDLAQASAVVRKLSGLGGLKTVYLTVWATQLEALMPLLEAVYSVHGLQELFVTIDEECEGQVLAARSDVEVGPSLTALYYSANTADPFLHRLLRSHAATLQRVALPCMKDAPMSLLANIANLRSLRCFFQDDLCALVGLPNLEKIDLTYKEIVEVGGMGTMEYGLIPVTDPQFPQKFPAGALSFLRRALRLRYVLLCLSLENPIAPLLALAESPSAQALERLVVIGTSDRMHQLPADFLSFFPALKRLQLDAAPPDALLRTIDSASVPCLMTLVVLWFPKDGCIHSWVHGPAIQDLLVRNPRLHLQVVNRSSDECSCRWCRWGCHPQLKGADLFNLSSHSRMIQCPENCLQVTDWSCSSCARKEGN